MNHPQAIIPYSRPAFQPLVEAGDQALIASKYSGQPWLTKGEVYPCCSNCQLPLQLFLQLHLDELPEPLRGSYGEGLVQLFYCTNQDAGCESKCGAFFPFSKSVMARLVTPEEGSYAPAAARVKDAFSPVSIVGWKEVVDFPNWEEGSDLGIELDDEEWEALQGPIQGDKLGGYPAWVQGVEYPNCPTCSQPMRLLFQIDSEVNIPYMFGDMGTGHITQCLEHKHQLAFAWACS